MKEKREQIAYSKQAKKQYLSLTLSELFDVEDIPSLYMEPEIRDINKIYSDLIVRTPTNQSHLGRNNSVPENKYSAVIRKLCNDLNIEDNNIFLFESYNSNKSDHINLYDDVKKCKDTFIAYRTSNGIFLSLYAGIRNALAHGNIIYYKDFYYFYSVQSGSKDANEYTSNISFLLKIKDCKRLKSLTKILEIGEKI